MNTQIINAELALALRKCLPFVRHHAIISGGDGSLTYAFAVRALADADARVVEEQRVKNIVEAESRRIGRMPNWFPRVFDESTMFWYPSENALRVARTHGYADKMLAAFAKRRANASDYRVGRVNGTLSGADAFTQAARAVRPGEGYLPAAPPAKGCNCDVCTEARLRGLRRAGL